MADGQLVTDKHQQHFRAEISSTPMVMGCTRVVVQWAAFKQLALSCTHAPHPSQKSFTVAHCPMARALELCPITAHACMLDSHT